MGKKRHGGTDDKNMDWLGKQKIEEAKKELLMWIDHRGYGSKEDKKKSIDDAIDNLIDNLIKK